MSAIILKKKEVTLIKNWPAWRFIHMTLILIYWLPLDFTTFQISGALGHLWYGQVQSVSCFISHTWKFTNLLTSVHKRKQWKSSLLTHWVGPDMCRCSQIYSIIQAEHYSSLNTSWILWRVFTDLAVRALWTRRCCPARVARLSAQKLMDGRVRTEVLVPFIKTRQPLRDPVAPVTNEDQNPCWEVRRKFGRSPSLAKKGRYSLYIDPHVLSCSFLYLEFIKCLWTFCLEHWIAWQIALRSLSWVQ